MPINLTFEDARNILLECGDLGDTSADLSPRYSQIREALLFLKRFSDYQIFGVCADTQEEGLQALKSYAQALGYEINPPVEITDGPVYLKFNPNNRSFYCEQYTGTYRGVLVSYYSDFSDGYSNTHGHFPLDLFLVSA